MQIKHGFTTKGKINHEGAKENEEITRPFLRTPYSFCPVTLAEIAHQWGKAIPVQF